MNVQIANFENLLASYYDGTTAHEAAKHIIDLIRKEQHEMLSSLLRDYREKSITSTEEITFRASTDRLMKCVSACEIASLLNFIPDVRHTKFGRQMTTILENKHVRRYYEDFYPERMPQLFRSRLSGTNTITEKIRARDVNRLIIVFLDLDRRYMETLEDGYLLRMLDSFTIDGYRFSDVVNLIGEPDQFINRLLLAPKERDTLSKALNEFSLFMQFCFDLRRLLLKTDSYPLIQSAIWNHYGYWFEIIGDELQEQLGQALTRFLDWQSHTGNRAAVESVQKYVREARDVLTVLTSKKFISPVDLLIEDFASKTVRNRTFESEREVVQIDRVPDGISDSEPEIINNENTREALIKLRFELDSILNSHESAYPLTSVRYALVLDEISGEHKIRELIKRLRRPLQNSKVLQIKIQPKATILTLESKQRAFKRIDDMLRTNKQIEGHTVLSYWKLSNQTAKVDPIQDRLLSYQAWLPKIFKAEVDTETVKDLVQEVLLKILISSEMMFSFFQSPMRVVQLAFGVLSEWKEKRNIDQDVRSMLVHNFRQQDREDVVRLTFRIYDQLSEDEQEIIEKYWSAKFEGVDLLDNVNSLRRDREKKKKERSIDEEE